MNLLEQQIAMENEACEIAREHLEKIMNEAVAEGQADCTVVGKKIIRYNFETVRNAIAEKIEQAITPHGGAQAVYIPLLKSIVAAWVDIEDGLEHLYDIITLAVISTSLASALDTTHEKNSISAAGIDITRQIIDETHLYAVGKSDGSKEALQRQIKNVEKRVSVRNKQVYVRNLLKKHLEVKLNAPNTTKTALGTWLMYQAMGAGLDSFCVVQNYDNLLRVVPTQLLIDTYNKNADKILALAHRFEPMIVKPRPWTEPTNGAYYGRLRAYANLIRLQDCTTEYIEEYQAKLKQLDISEVYAAINAYQETAYKINTRVYDVLEAVIEKGGDIGSVPRMVPYDDIPSIPEDADADTVWRYKQQRVDWIHREIARKTKALRMLTTAGAAKKYKDFAEIYFPINLDWRGRMYPIPAMLTPQGDDVQKAVLEFAHPAPVENEAEAMRWLKIQLANTAGKDKLPYEERIAWVDEVSADILRVADDPLGSALGFWEGADEPWCFLAACFAYKDAVLYKAAHGGSLIGFECGLPIAMDATCSVLQHFASIMRSDSLAKYVNLKDEDTVQDIYGEVAKGVSEIVLKDAEKGTADAMDKRKDGAEYLKYGTKTLANVWLDYALETTGEKKISRKITKKCVMTYGYGSELYGFKERILNEFVKPFIDEKGGRENTMFADCATAAAGYMAKIIWQVVCKKLAAVEQTKDYIKEVCNVALDQDIDTITWTTPDGLLIQSSYNKVSKKPIRLFVAGKQVTIYSNNTLPQVDARKQCQAISPNFIHSRDAAHMRSVLRTCKAEGMNNYMMIHDSFAVEMSNAARLYTILRETFAEMYSNVDALEEFVEDLHHMAPLAQFPVLPEKGTYDVNEVKKAKYAFC